MIKKSFYDVRFLADNSIGSYGGPEFSTNVATTENIVEYRNINWSGSRNRYNLAPAIKSKEQLEYLISFFRICKGRAIGFRFKDWNDYQLKNEIIKVSEDNCKSIQISKTYSIGKFSSKRIITKPVPGSVEILLNNQIIHPFIDHSKGLVFFDNHLKKGDILNIGCEFDVPVRFDIDNLFICSEGKDLFSNQEIPLVEVKE